MSIFSAIKGSYGIIGTATPEKSGVDQAAVVGISPSNVSLTGTLKVVAITAVMGGFDDQFIWNPVTLGVSTSDTASGQVETLVCAGTCTVAGTISVVVTGLRIPGGSVGLTIAIPAAAATSWADNVRLALKNNVVIASVYSISGTGASVILTEKYPGMPNDNSLNVTLTAISAVGPTTITNSTNTTLGVAGTGFQNLTGDGNDNEGLPLPNSTLITGWLLKVDLGSVIVQSVEEGLLNWPQMGEGCTLQFLCQGILNSMRDSNLIIKNADTSPARVGMVISYL